MMSSRPRTSPGPTTRSRPATRTNTPTPVIALTEPALEEPVRRGTGRRTRGASQDAPVPASAPAPIIPTGNRQSKAFGTDELGVTNDVNTAEAGYFETANDEAERSVPQDSGRQPSPAKRGGRAASEALSETSNKSATRRGRPPKASATTTAVLSAIDEEESSTPIFTAAQKGKGKMSPLSNGNGDQTTDLDQSGNLFGPPETVAETAKRHLIPVRRAEDLRPEDFGPFRTLPGQQLGAEDQTRFSNIKPTQRGAGRVTEKYADYLATLPFQTEKVRQPSRRHSPARPPPRQEEVRLANRLTRYHGFMLTCGFTPQQLTTIGWILIGLILAFILSLLAWALDFQTIGSIESKYDSVKHALPAMPNFPSIPNIPNLGSYLPNLSSIGSKYESSAAYQKVQIDGVKAELDKLKRTLPQALAVDYDNGQYKIPDGFWEALQGRINDTYTHDAHWEAFIAANEKKTRDFLDRAANRSISHMFDKHRVVTKDEFVGLLKQELLGDGLLLDNINARMRKFENEVKDEILTRLNADIKRQVAQLPQKFDLASLVAANIVANNDIAIKRVNFFAASGGARVDPFLSSPTKYPPQSNWVASWLAPRPKPHLAALEPWTEPGDCWCGAHTNPIRQNRDDEKHDAKLQLAVLIAYDLVPRRVTIEHFPRQGTMEKQHAPRKMELWAEIQDAHALRLAKERSQRIFAGVDSDTDLSLSKMGIPHNFVRIGEFSYDWEGPNHVQTFSVAVGLDLAGATTRKIILRAMSNYGAPFTCLYRVRVHGDADGHKDAA